MKIVYVDYKYHYGKKELGLNTIALDGFIASFEQLGHLVFPFFYDELSGDREKLHMELVKFCDKEKPDLIFFLLSHDLFCGKVISELSKKYITMNFFGDDHWRFDNFTKKLANSFTYCITTDPFSVKKYGDIGVKNNLILSQWAALEIKEQARDEVVSYEYDISFIGGKNPYREWVVEHLLSLGLHVECFGVGWKNGPVSSYEMSNIFKKSKINLNISNSCSYDLRFFWKKPLSFLRQLRSIKTSSQIKARNFEIPALNGFQLTDYVPFLERYFSIGNEICCYSDINDLVDMINYFLECDEERERIKAASYNRAIKEHFYINRILPILDEIK
ncbi:CgeB family protein [Vibrio ouci]|uniref:Spore protein YkvP/CgeB glycosyl transferase-like domain-containing protein n=1 Tax=Vibrio ouci TaxID=2499078 RepID=A0A4Y8WJZ6_9VIBR|nr:glycosyltransferase [Vibrio ouci]TFH92996.1 hypothetical protein ELS82_03320 [Vibrio ouci]